MSTSIDAAPACLPPQWLDSVTYLPLLFVKDLVDFPSSLLIFSAIQSRAWQPLPLETLPSGHRVPKVLKIMRIYNVLLLTFSARFEYRMAALLSHLSARISMPFVVEVRSSSHLYRTSHYCLHRYCCLTSVVGESIYLHLLSRHSVTDFQR